MYKIIVSFKCEDKNDAPLMAKKLKDLEMLIDEVDSFQVNLDTVGAENSYDYSLIGTFRSIDEYQRYLVHPIHMEYRDQMNELGVKSVKVCFEE